MYNFFCVWIHVLNSPGYQGVELVDQIRMILCLNFLKRIQTALQNECTTLHGHQQCWIKFYIPILDQILLTIKFFFCMYVLIWVSQVALVVKNLLANAEDMRCGLDP